MAILTTHISDLQCPESKLRVQSVPSADFDGSISYVVSELIEALSAVDYGTGLSAIQIGMPVRVAIITLDRPPGDEMVLVDPVVISISGRRVTRSEGCLSLPRYKGSVIRRNKITFSAHDLNGKPYTYSAKGYEAAIIQHELDHMDGLFFWDRMDSYQQLHPIED